MTAQTPDRPRDTNQLAKHVVDVATGECSLDTEPVDQGRQGARLSRRSEIAREAARTRWGLAT